ncbi:hypothetical protein RJO84_004258 [Enterobacter hormaechei]|uniref:hypothetical protein n=1 Tax=Klebsiella pneumoniae TaxID=573 RepID=UPI001A1F51F4|nr:hypothetical protein [Klebsiella pneumoniae]ELC7446972.1 hypothetical protein [Enterobacter hormaechei]HAT7569517.1 hypothetical protein [Citrobacter werkmanii]
MNSYKLPTFGINYDEIGMEWANACVGNNGYVDSKQYYDGYIQAAIKLMEVIFKSEEKENFECQYWIDTFIYPICFSLRHAIEILLKRISETIILISKARKREEDISIIEKNIAHHDINLIWNGLKHISISNDERYEFLLNKIEPFICEIGEIDPTGQTFRYAYSNDSVKHLTDIRIISIARLYENTIILQSDMKDLFDLNDLIYQEYCLNTFTKNLSRHKLQELAKDLPQKIEWSNELTSTYKKNLISKYKISSNELTKAINIISNHYEMSYYIGIEVPLLGVDIKNIFSFLELWLKNEKVISKYNLNVSDGIKISELTEIIYSNEQHFNFLTPDFVAGLFTLCYYAIEADGCEQYIYRYNLKYNQYINIDTSWNMMHDIQHLLCRKINLMENILRSMHMLNQRVMIKSILERYSFLHI